MLIDWFTVGAQVFNFIILVWLMKRFLYQPILTAIDTREKNIANQLAHAETLSTEASEAKTNFERKNQQMDEQRQTLMAEATQAADSEGKRLLEEARQSAKDLEEKQLKAHQQKMQELYKSIRTAAQKQLFVMTKNALHDLADVEIESQIITVFLKQLRAMNPEQVNELHAALKSNKIEIISSSALSSDQQSAITKTLHDIIGKDSPLTFDQSDNVIGGIEVTANGFKIGWSIAEYLHSLEDALTEQQETHIEPNEAKDKSPKSNDTKESPALTNQEDPATTKTDSAPSSEPTTRGKSK